MPGYLPSDPGRARVDAPTALATRSGCRGTSELESEDFNRAFRVSTAIAAARPRTCCRPRTMEMLMTRPAFAWRTQGTDLVTWAPGVIDPMDLLARLDTMEAVIDGVPPLRVARSGHRSGRSGSNLVPSITVAPNDP